MNIKIWCCCLFILLLGGQVCSADAEPPGWVVDEEVFIPLGESFVIDSPSRLDTVVVVDPDILDVQPVGARQAILLGRKPGRTDVVLKLENDQTVWRRVTVGIDSREFETRLEHFFAGDLIVKEVDGVISISGRLPNAEAAEGLTRYMNESGMKWVDLTTIPGPQQVQLRVRIAEASREALRELAVDMVVGGSSAFGGSSPTGSTPLGISMNGGAPVNSRDFIWEAGKNAVSAATTLFGGVPSANLEVFLKALNQNSYIRMLAEPNLVALSGESASFLVGGEFPVPIVQGTNVGAGSTVTIEYKEFGVKLDFRPLVMGDGRIRLEVAPEVSELSEGKGSVQLQGWTIPAIVTRRSRTTVELQSGETFAMAGLLQSNTTGAVDRIPVLGDIPILGPLFRSVRYRESETELLVLVTAEFVAPMSNGDSLPVPGQLHARPNDWELFMDGRLDGSITAPSVKATFASMGLGALHGPGAWRNPEEPRQVARDVVVNPADDASNVQDDEAGDS